MSETLHLPDRLQLIEHRRWVRALAARLLADENDVDDVEQDTWRAALASGPAEPRALRSWLGVVASRFALQRLRGRSRDARRDAALVGPPRTERATADVVADADAHGHVVQAVLELDEPYRTTVLLRYFEGLEVAEVARRTGAPLETVRTRLRRARERLRETLAVGDEHRLAALLVPLASSGPEGACEASGRSPKGKSTGGAGRLAASVALVAAAGAGLWVVTRGAGEDAAHEGELAAANADDGGPPPARVEPPPAPPRERRGGATGPALASDAAVPPPVASADARSSEPEPWRARDVADGRALGGLELRFVTKEGERTVVTDADGRIPLDRATVIDVAPVLADVWTFARPVRTAVADEPALFFWREREFVAVVRSADPSGAPVPQGVTLSWTLSSAAFTAAGVPPLQNRWLSDHGFRPEPGRPVASVRTGTDGCLVARDRFLAGVMITAEAEGWSPAAARLAADASGACVLTFGMRPAVSVIGRLLGPDGAPLAGERVSLEIAIATATPEEAARALALRPHGGAIYGGREGKGVVGLLASAKTDVRGIFRFEATAEGKGAVIARVAGFAVARQDLGAMGPPVAPFEMRLARSDIRVLLREGGVPTQRTSLTLQAMDGGENGFMAPVEPGGLLDAGQLERGRWYTMPTARGVRALRWNGETEIDLDRLGTRADAAK